jgi:hypothetical protein
MAVDITCTLKEANYLRLFLEKEGKGGRKIALAKGYRVSPNNFLLAYHRRGGYVRLFHKSLDGEKPQTVEGTLEFYLKTLLVESLKMYRKAEEQDLSEFDFNF